MRNHEQRLQAAKEVMLAQYQQAREHIEEEKLQQLQDIQQEIIQPNQEAPLLANPQPDQAVIQLAQLNDQPEQPQNQPQLIEPQVVPDQAQPQQHPQQTAQEQQAKSSCIIC